MGQISLAYDNLTQSEMRRLEFPQGLDFKDHFGDGAEDQWVRQPKT